MHLAVPINMAHPHDSTADWGSDFHAPVLVSEVLGILPAGGRVLDGTLGGGGHSAALLESGHTVSALDRDPAAIAAAAERLVTYISQGRFHAYHENFANLDRIPELAGVRFDGILLDLGVSSHQLDAGGRGFTFREGAPLDMRMDAEAPSAAELLAESSPETLERIFREYGDERRARRLAAEVVRRRATRPFRTSDDFVGAIRAVLGPSSGPPEFARLFQALRIAVNEELDALEHALPMLRERLVSGGVLAVIAYHSGEDRIVKHTMAGWSAHCICPPRQPMCTCRGHALGSTLTKKPVNASPDELSRNPRARSAHLRAWRKE